jgi:hypothetical protein
MHEVDVAHLGIAADVVGLARPAALEDRAQRAAVVADVEPVADVAPVASRQPLPIALTIISERANCSGP